MTTENTPLEKFKKWTTENKVLRWLVLVGFLLISIKTAWEVVDYYKNKFTPTSKQSSLSDIKQQPIGPTAEKPPEQLTIKNSSINNSPIIQGNNNAISIPSTSPDPALPTKPIQPRNK